MARSQNFRIVLVTCGSVREARKIARVVVAKRLAACVNIGTAAVESVYRWKGRVEGAKEHLLVIKTHEGKLKALEKEVLSLHSYDTPEFLVLNITAGSAAYLSWLTQSVGRDKTPSRSHA